MRVEKGKKGSERRGLCRNFRINPTSGEAFVWARLRARRFDDLKFRRQHPLGAYIADFACVEHGIIVEVDGGIHSVPEHRENDLARDQALAQYTFRTFHIRDEDLLDNPDSVFEQLRHFIFESTNPSAATIPTTSSPSPSPMERGRGGEATP